MCSSQKLHKRVVSYTKFDRQTVTVYMMTVSHLDMNAYDVMYFRVLVLFHDCDY